MHFAVVAVGPRARRLAFGATDSVLYSGQIKEQDYARQPVHSIYVRDKSEIRVYGSSSTAVHKKAAELRAELDDTIEYIAGVVYVEGLSKGKAS